MVMKLWLSPRTFVCKERYDQESISVWGINVCTADIIHLKSKKKLFLGPVHTYPDIFESATFSFRIPKFPHPHLSVFKANLPVHAYPTRIWIHSSSQGSSRNIGNRAWVEVAFLNNGKELGSVLLRHRFKKNVRIQRPHDSGFIAYSKNSTLESGFKELRSCKPDSPDTCGRKPYLGRKSWGFKNVRIRVHGALVDQIKKKKALYWNVKLVYIQHESSN